jgi:hypothetical protein
MDCFALQWESTAFVRKGDGLLFQRNRANDEWHVHEFHTTFHNTDAIQFDQMRLLRSELFSCQPTEPVQQVNLIGKCFTLTLDR